jgi:hypothetical protein
MKQKQQPQYLRKREEVKKLFKKYLIDFGKVPELYEEEQEIDKDDINFNE